MKVSHKEFKRLFIRQIQLSDEFVSRAKVILTTNVGAGGNKLNSIKKSPVVIMDLPNQLL